MSKARPILFSAPMVRALLNGSKTQTRRVLKRQPHDEWYPAGYGELHGYDKHGELTPDKVIGWGAFNEDGDQGYCCPHGQPGDRLWVREAYADIGFRLTYRADEDDGAHCLVKKWTPSIHMFRDDSRILLEIISVRVERLNDISQEDARAEGIVDGGCTHCGESEKECGCENPMPDYADGFFGLWQSINGSESLIANPWVWCIEFSRVAP